MKTIYVVEGWRLHEDSYPIRAFSSEVAAKKFEERVRKSVLEFGGDSEYSFAENTMVTVLEYVDYE